MVGVFPHFCVPMMTEARVAPLSSFSVTSVGCVGGASSGLAGGVTAAGASPGSCTPTLAYRVGLAVLASTGLSSAMPTTAPFTCSI